MIGQEDVKGFYYSLTIDKINYFDRIITLNIRPTIFIGNENSTLTFIWRENGYDANETQLLLFDYYDSKSE